MRPTTLGRTLRATAARHGDRLAFATVGKDATRLTYREVFAKVGGYARVLAERGVRRGDRVVILGENSPEWAFTDWACHCIGAVVVPIYPTLPADQAQHIAKDSGAELAVCASAEHAAKLPDLPALLLRGAASLDSLAAAASVDPAWLEAEIDAADPEDPCSIIYTSGTTGLPKGAVMPNRAFLHVAIAAERHVQVSEQDAFLSFLPMSHVYERVAGQVLPVYLGASICYSRSLMQLANEMREFQPTIMLCVPRFLENFRERVMDRADRGKPLRRRLFYWALAQGARRNRGEFAPLAGLADRLVGAKVREAAGGRFRYFVSGGAALGPAVAEFLSALGFTVLQGYGLTETSGGSCINRPEDNKYWTVGEPLDMEVRLGEDGEILMRGPALFLGYHNLPEETARVLDGDGWFHTGDIGAFEGRHLKITDRKKDLIVLGNGKNVAPQPIENKLAASTYIAEAVVLGDGMDHCAALLVPRADLVRQALALGEETRLSESSAVRDLLKKEVDKVNRTVANYETVKKFAVLDQPFSIDSGELTPTLKVKRKVVKERYAELIQTLWN